MKALSDFQGAVLLITHDPNLVELVADRLWLVADGTVKPFDGDLDDYRALLVERARPAAKAGAVTRKDDRRERAEARAALAPIRKQAQEAEKRIAALAARTGQDRGQAGRPGDVRPREGGRRHRRQHPPGRHRQGSLRRRGSLLLAEEALEAAS